MTKLLILFLLFAGPLVAQTDTLLPPPVVEYNLLEDLSEIDDNGGKVSIHCDSNVTALIGLHVLLNKKQKTFTGYRVQIFSGSSFDYPVSRLQEMKEEFEKQFPDIPAYLNYFDPDFKIRVGNFRTRLECIPVLKKVRRYYPSSYPVKTEIPISDLIKTAPPETQETSDPDEQNWIP